MLAAAALAAVLIGWALGGRLSRLAECPLRALGLPIAAYAVQAAGQLLSPRLSWGRIGPFVIVLSYGMLFIFLFLNRRMRKAALLMGMGSLSNALVIICNGFRMPVGAAAAASMPPERLAALRAGEIPMYISAEVSGRLSFLADGIALPGLGAASVGDVLLVIGLFFCLMAVMRPVRPAAWRAFWAAG